VLPDAVHRPGRRRGLVARRIKLAAVALVKKTAMAISALLVHDRQFRADCAAAKSTELCMSCKPASDAVPRR
jgi:hypothetical protein